MLKGSLDAFKSCQSAAGSWKTILILRTDILELKEIIRHNIIARYSIVLNYNNHITWSQILYEKIWKRYSRDIQEI